MIKGDGVDYFASIDGGEGSRLSGVSIKSGRATGFPDLGVVTQFTVEKENNPPKVVYGYEVNRYKWVMSRYPFLSFGISAIILLTSMRYPATVGLGILTLIILLYKSRNSKQATSRIVNISNKALFYAPFILPFVGASLFFFFSNLQLINSLLQILIFGFLSIYSIVLGYTILEKYKKVWVIAKNMEDLDKIKENMATKYYIWQSGGRD